MALAHGTRFLIAQQRHGGGLSWPMTALTVFLENRKDVLRESNRRGLIGRYGGHGHREPGENQTHHHLAS
jgi:hypothetical protein